MHRRKLLKKCASVLIAAAIAGCSDSTVEGDSGGSGRSDADGVGVSDSNDDFPNDTSRSESVDWISDSDELNEEYYMAYEFTLLQPITLDNTVEVV